MDMAVLLIQISVANSKKILQDEGIAEWQNIEKQGGDDHLKPLNIQTPKGIFNHNTRIKTKYNLCRGVAYLTVLCDHLYLVFLILAFCYPCIYLGFLLLVNVIIW